MILAELCTGAVLLRLAHDPRFYNGHQLNVAAAAGSCIDLIQTWLHYGFLSFQILAHSMTGISNHAKQSQTEEFCESVRNFADAICGITENAAHVSIKDLAGASSVCSCSLQCIIFL